MERTLEQPVSVRRWLVGGMLAALLLASGPAMKTALAEDEELGIDVGSLSEPGYLCDGYWNCVSAPDYTWPDQTD